MAQSEQTIVHFKVIGKVQGVCFRAETKDRATSLKLEGYCENRPDESVEGVAYGPTDKISEFRKYLNQGPAAAKVERVEYMREIEGPATSVVQELLGRDHKGKFEVRRR